MELFMLKTRPSHQATCRIWDRYRANPAEDYKAHLLQYSRLVSKAQMCILVWAGWLDINFSGCFTKLWQLYARRSMITCRETHYHETLRGGYLAMALDEELRTYVYLLFQSYPPGWHLPLPHLYPVLTQLYWWDGIKMELLRKIWNQFIHELKNNPLVKVRRKILQNGGYFHFVITREGTMGVMKN